MKLCPRCVSVHTHPIGGVSPPLPIVVWACDDCDYQWEVVP